MNASDGRLHPLTLRFVSDELETGWRAYDARTSLLRIRFTLALALFLYVAFGWLDWTVAREIAPRLWAIRGVVCAGILLVLAATWHPSFGRVRHVFLGGVILVTGGGILAMLLLTEGRIESLYYVGLILVVMATHAFGWVRFPLAIILSLLLVAGYDLVLALDPDVETVVVVNNHFFFLSATILGMVASYTGERFARWSYWNARRAEDERARSDALLWNILPEPVAERLKKSPGRVAEGFTEVTVLFADIVDFSGLASHLSPEALVDFLDGVFTDLDGVAAEFGIEKIKTMGDAYVAVSGLPERVPDHAERMAEMALAIVERIDGRPVVAGEPVRFRIGIAIGPVVAGVIGQAKFVYDLWGTPVTVASRMQALGEPGRIHASDFVRRRLRHAYVFESRGLIEIKGIGTAPTWWLTGRKREASGVGASELAPPAGPGPSFGSERVPG